MKSYEVIVHRKAKSTLVKKIVSYIQWLEKRDIEQRGADEIRADLTVFAKNVMAKNSRIKPAFIGIGENTMCSIVWVEEGEANARKRIITIKVRDIAPINTNY